MEQTYPRFTPDMKKTHKILIPNMAPVQFRILAASMETVSYTHLDVYKRQLYHRHD